MKKLITMLVIVIIMTMGAKAGGHLGMGITQNPAAPTAKLFDNKTDYKNFFGGIAFPMDSGSLYPGLTMKAYRGYLPLLVKFHNASARAQLTEINRITDGQLAIDFGFPTGPIEFTDAMYEQVFMSNSVRYGLTPQNEKVTYDGVDVLNKCLFPITRGFHIVGKSKQAETGWWLYVTGYEPIYIKSAYCNNNVDNDWIASHLVKTDVPSDDGQGNVLPKMPDVGATDPKTTAPKSVNTTCKTDQGSVPKSVNTTCKTDGSTPKSVSTTVKGNLSTSTSTTVKGNSNQTTVSTQPVGSAGPSSDDYNF